MWNYKIRDKEIKKVDKEKDLRIFIHDYLKVDIYVIVDCI